MALLEHAFSRDGSWFRFIRSLNRRIDWLTFVSPMQRRRRPNPDSEENIRRIDTKRRARKQTHGFQVHFLRGDRVVTKMFSDSLYGGKEGARRAARKFKRTIQRRLPRRKFLGPG